MSLSKRLHRSVYAAHMLKAQVFASGNAKRRWARGNGMCWAVWGKIDYLKYWSARMNYRGRGSENSKRRGLFTLDMVYSS